MCDVTWRWGRNYTSVKTTLVFFGSKTVHLSHNNLHLTVPSKSPPNVNILKPQNHGVHKHLLELAEPTNQKLGSGRHSRMSEIYYFFLFVTNYLPAKGKNLVGKSLCCFLSPWTLD